VLDYRTFLRRIEQLSSETPLIIEHLAGKHEFDEAARYIKQVAREVDVSL